MAGPTLPAPAWKTTSFVRIRNFLDGTPAGGEINVATAWAGLVAYVTGSSGAVYRELISELSRYFRTDKARSVIRDCAARDPSWIQEYADKHLELDSESPGPRPASTAVDSATESASLYDPLGNSPEEHSGEATSGQAARGQEGPRDQPSTETNSGLASKANGNPRPRSDERDSEDPFRNYMTALGFRWDADSETFSHADGRTVRVSDGIFHWLLETPACVWRIADFGRTG